MWLEQCVEEKAPENSSNIHYVNLEFLFLCFYFLESANEHLHALLVLI